VDKKLYVLPSPTTNTLTKNKTQRVVIVCMHSVGRAVGGDMMDLRNQKKVFGDAAYLGVIVAVAIAEIAAADMYPPPPPPLAGAHAEGEERGRKKA